MIRPSIVCIDISINDGASDSKLFEDVSENSVADFLQVYLCVRSRVGRSLRLTSSDNIRTMRLAVAIAVPKVKRYICWEN